jgi:hypothetical protein
MIKNCNPKSPKSTNVKYTCNPKTGRWVLKSGKIGKSLVKTKSPQVKPKSKSPQVKPKTKSPQVKPKSKSPQVKPKSKSPQVKPKTKPLQVKPKTKPLQIKPKSKSPQVKPKNKKLTKSEINALYTPTIEKIRNKLNEIWKNYDSKGGDASLFKLVYIPYPTLQLPHTKKTMEWFATLSPEIFKLYEKILKYHDYLNLDDVKKEQKQILKKIDSIVDNQDKKFKNGMPSTKKFVFNPYPHYEIPYSPQFEKWLKTLPTNVFENYKLIFNDKNNPYYPTNKIPNFNW